MHSVAILKGLLLLSLGLAAIPVMWIHIDRWPAPTAGCTPDTVYLQGAAVELTRGWDPSTRTMCAPFDVPGGWAAQGGYTDAAGDPVFATDVLHSIGVGGLDKSGFAIALYRATTGWFLGSLSVAAVIGLALGELRSARGSEEAI